jgi:hypothetical protein
VDITAIQIAMFHVALTKMHCKNTSASYAMLVRLSVCSHVPYLMCVTNSYEILHCGCLDLCDLAWIVLSDTTVRMNLLKPTGYVH